MSTDWKAWHEQYEDPHSDLASRLAVVQAFIRDFLDARSGHATKVVSLCAGTGWDLLGVLSARPAEGQVSARLVELDPDLANKGRETARGLGLRSIEVAVADAGMTDVYVGAVPADLVIACGVFGNISDQDVEQTIRALPTFCSRGGVVLWTRHRRAPDLTPAVRRLFTEVGFDELALISPGAGSFAVGAHRLEGPGSTLVTGQRLFTFIR